jgi:CubicO group peptidase (beta-lactamase class C family)
MRKYFIFFLTFAIFSSCKKSPTESVWETSSPTQQGMDVNKLNTLSNKIQAGDYNAIHSLLVVRHGYLVFEKYYRGYNKDKLEQVYSVTKSVTSTLIGIAKDKGNITSTSTKLLSFFPEYATSSIVNYDTNKAKITLDDVLTMRAGFQWDEQSAPYGTSGNPTYQLSRSSDWIKYMLDVQISYVPGTHFTYNSGCTILLSGILRNTTNKRADVFAKENLLTPLGIVEYSWEIGPQNITNTGWGLYLKPRDMAKFGQMILKKGTWNGKRIVSESWLATATTNHVPLRTYPYSYGYQWWMIPFDSSSQITPKPNDIRFAWGYGGQFIFVIPYYDMVVVSTAGNTSGDDDTAAIRFLKDYILKAVNS